MKSNLLNDIMNLECEISKLSIEKQKLGLKYVQENFPYNKKDIVEIIDEKNKTYIVKIVNIWFDSHSPIVGLVKFIGMPLNKKYELIPNRSGLLFGNDPIKSINKIQHDRKDIQED